MKLTVFCVLATIAISQALPGTFFSYKNTRITGGSEASPHQFPYQVGLNVYLENGNEYFCGGSLISEWYVLTAAHCTDGVKKMEVVLGAHNVNDPKESTQIRMNSSVIIPHEKWYATMLLNDIAVVKLPKKVAFNKYIQAIHLPDSDDNDYTGETAVVSGWGKLSDDSHVMADTLHFVDSDVISVQQCQSRYPKVIKDTHLCISAKDGKSSCSGDSGGPLVIEKNGATLQIGIVSFGYPTCETNHPAVYTRITKYLDWIKKNAELK